MACDAAARAPGASPCMTSRWARASTAWPRSGEPVTALAGKTAGTPVNSKRDGKLDTVRLCSGLGLPERVFKRGPDVGVLAAQFAHPGELVVVEEMVTEVPGHGQVAGDEAAPRAARVAGRVEPFGAELADGV